MAIVLPDHNEVLDARDGGPPIKVEDICRNFLVPLGRFVLVLLNGGLQLLFLLVGVDLVETLAADDGGNSVREEGRHFARTLHAEEVGLVFDRDGLFLAGWVEGVEAASSEGELAEVAVELRPEEVGSQSSHDLLGVYWDSAGFQCPFVLGNDQVSLLVLQNSDEISKRGGLVEMVLDCPGFRLLPLDDALQDCVRLDGFEVVSVVGLADDFADDGASASAAVVGFFFLGTGVLHVQDDVCLFGGVDRLLEAAGLIFFLGILLTGR